MKQKFNSIVNSVIYLSILAILIGITLLVWPAASIFTIAILTGVHFVIQGIAQIAIGVKAAKYHLPYDGTAYGVLSVIFGIIAITIFASEPEVTVATLGIIYGIAIGIWIIVSAIYDIKVAMFLKKVPNSNWGLLIVMAILSVFLGIFIMITPITTTLSVTMLIGSVLIAHGIIKLVDIICLKGKAEEYENAVKKKTMEISNLINKG